MSPAYGEIVGTITSGEDRRSRDCIIKNVPSMQRRRFTDKAEKRETEVERLQRLQRRWHKAKAQWVAQGAR